MSSALTSVRRDSPNHVPSANRRSYGRPVAGVLVAVTVAVVFLAIPALAGVPARLVEGCGKWIAAAGTFELLSAVGFVLFFKLVFAAPTSWRQSVPSGLRALGASTILPAGGLIGPTVGAWSASTEKPSLSQLTRSTITFVILTNAPAAVALTALGTSMWLGVPSGAHALSLTLIPAMLGSAVLAAAWRAGCPSRRTRARRRSWRATRRLAKPIGAVGEGVTDARTLLRGGDWKLVGALAYVAFDCAVLWAAFHAYGHTPPVAVIVMGYLVGSLAGALPLPAGLGVVDGGLVGALVLYGAPVAPAAGAVLLYRGISLSLPALLGALGCMSRPAAPSPRGVDGRHGRSLAGTRARRRAAAELVTARVES